MVGYFAFMDVCAQIVCMVPVEVRRGSCSPQNWSHRQSWVLEIKAGCSARPASALNHGDISPTLIIELFKKRKKKTVILKLYLQRHPLDER